MSYYKAQVSFQDNSGLSKDRFENDFYFAGSAGPAIPQDGAAIAERLTDFYNGNGGAPAAQGLYYYLCNSMSRQVTVKVYDAEAKGPPLYQSSFLLQDGAGTQDLPEQIALCMSFYGLTNTPTGRGRVYLGPFNASALFQLVNPRPAALLIQSIVNAGGRLRMSGDGVIPIGVLTGPQVIPAPGLGDVVPTAANIVTWQQHSHKTGNFQPVLHGWADNEWDGQHRRRIAASARSAF